MTNSLGSKFKFGLMSFLVFTILTVNCFAQDEDSHEEGEHERHHIGIFFGATTNLDDEETDFSLGLDYEYRLLPQLGIGLLGEVTFAENEVFIVGVPIFLHPSKGLILGVAPGVEISDEIAETEAEGGEQLLETKTNFLLRFIAAYEMEFNGLTLAPTVSLDLVDGEESLVYGISLGKGF